MVVKVRKYADGGKVYSSEGDQPKYTRSVDKNGHLTVKRNTTVSQDIGDIVKGVTQNAGGLVGQAVDAFKNRKAGMGYADGGKVKKLGGAAGGGVNSQHDPSAGEVSGSGWPFRDGGRVGKLGSGSRFAAIAKSAAASGARDPNAVAAAAGIKAHGKKQMAKWAAAGRKGK